MDGKVEDDALQDENQLDPVKRCFDERCLVLNATVVCVSQLLCSLLLSLWGMEAGQVHWAALSLRTAGSDESSVHIFWFWSPAVQPVKQQFVYSDNQRCHYLCVFMLVLLMVFS